MWLFPYDRFSIISSLKPADAIRRLTENITRIPPGNYFKNISFWFRRNFDQYFMGSISGNLFKIYRAIKGRNSFIPMIKCVISEDAEGSKILVRMRIHPIVLIFCFWILIIGWFYKSHIKNIVFVYNSTPIFIFIGMYCLTLFMFKYEVQKDKETLLDIFDGEIET